MFVCWSNSKITGVSLILPQTHQAILLLNHPWYLKLHSNFKSLKSPNWDGNRTRQPIGPGPQPRHLPRPRSPRLRQGADSRTTRLLLIFCQTFSAISTLFSLAWSSFTLGCYFYRTAFLYRAGPPKKANAKKQGERSAAEFVASAAESPTPQNLSFQHVRAQRGRWHRDTA